jgi:hypothetical protein
MDSASVLGKVLGGRQPCGTHQWPQMAAVIDSSEEILGQFFRIAALRELIGRPPADEPGLRDKACAIVGIATGLGKGALQRGMKEQGASQTEEWHKACYDLPADQGLSIARGS